MAKFCGKCGAKLEEETGFCPNCDAEKREKEVEDINAIHVEEKKETEKEKPQKTPLDINGKKRKNIFILVGCMILIGCIIGGLFYFHLLPIQTSRFTDEDSLGDIHKACIVIQEKEISMENETSGTAEIVIEMPDYEQLFRQVLDLENPEEALREALLKKEYQIQTFEKTAEVTVENGETIIHSDKIVETLLEESLIEAINALTGVKE